MNSTEIDAPIVLVSSVSVPRFGATPLNFADMAARARGWLRITEMSFSIDPVVTVVSPLGPLDHFGGLINIDAGIGRHRITNGQVPVWMLGPRLSYYGEVGQRRYLQNAGILLPNINCYTWKLPKPMLVPPGTSMGMLITRPVTSPLQDPAAVFAAAWTVEVAVKGVRLAKPPKVRETDIPYVTNFRTLPTTTTTILESGQGFATGGSLANPFTKPLLIERFNQRTAFGGDGGYAGDFNIYSYNAGGIGGSFGPTVGPSNLRLRIFQNHYEVMSETVPKPQAFSGGAVGSDTPQGKCIIDSVFNPQWATWRVGQELAPKEWYNAEFSADRQFSQPTPSPSTTWDIAPMLTMVGSRRESI